MGKLDQKITRVRAKNCKSSCRKRLSDARVGDVRAGLPQNYVAPVDYLRQSIIIAGQLQQAFPRSLVQVPEGLDGFVWRGAIRLWEDNIETHSHGLHLVQSSEQVRNQSPRPWPLPKRSDTVLINVDDGNRSFSSDSRFDVLIEIKGSKLYFLKY